MISVGFAPRVEGFGLERTGVQLTERGAIEIDERMRTNVPHIYAIGDVTAKLQLAHVAEAQGVVAAETIGGAETMELGDYRMMPRATFCQPQVASFGLTEQQARDEGYDVKVATFPFTANGKAHGLGDASGFVKLIADTKHVELLGGHLIGPDVSELLPELTLAQKWDLTATELARNVHTHPTLCEALQEAHPRPRRPHDQLLTRAPSRHPRAHPARVPSRAERYAAVRLVRTAATCSGVPSATTRPPSAPAPGPRSITRSAAATTPMSCSTTTTVLPASTSPCSWAISTSTSAGCRPVVGSSSR